MSSTINESERTGKLTQSDIDNRIQDLQLNTNLENEDTDVQSGGKEKLYKLYQYFSNNIYVIYIE